MYVFMSRRDTASDVMPSSIMMPAVSYELVSLAHLL